MSQGAIGVARWGGIRAGQGAKVKRPARPVTPGSGRRASPGGAPRDWQRGFRRPEEEHRRPQSADERLKKFGGPQTGRPGVTGSLPPGSHSGHRGAEHPSNAGVAVSPGAGRTVGGYPAERQGRGEVSGPGRGNVGASGPPERLAGQRRSAEPSAPDQSGRVDRDVPHPARNMPVTSATGPDDETVPLPVILGDAPGVHTAGSDWDAVAPVRLARRRPDGPSHRGRGTRPPLDQLKALYRTAEAIGEEALTRHFDQLSQRQRNLIHEYFEQAGPGAHQWRPGHSRC